MTANRARPLRSLLFVPGEDPRRIAKAMASTADAVILDLEDAVAVSRKPDARRRTAAAVGEASHPALYVRVNPASTPDCLADLEATVRPGLAAVMLAKATGVADVSAVAWAMGQLERQRGLAPDSIDLVPLIESAAGLVALESICTAARRIRRVAFGAADFTADLGIEWTAAEVELELPRRTLVTVSRATGLEPPLDSPLLAFRDTERMRQAAIRSRGLGFQGKLCIHPAQIEPCHAAFAPTPQEVERARQAVAAFDLAERQGVAAIEVDGALVDYAVVVRARRILASI